MFPCRKRQQLVDTGHGQSTLDPVGTFIHSLIHSCLHEFNTTEHLQWQAVSQVLETKW